MERKTDFGPRPKTGEQLLPLALMRFLLTIRVIFLPFCGWEFGTLNF